MKSIIWILTVASVGIWSQITWALGPDQTYIMCKNKGEVRTLRIHRDSPGQNCIVTYTKGGADSRVGFAKQSAFCLSVLTGIRSRLEKNNWTCRDISPAIVHSGADESNGANAATGAPPKAKP